MTDFNRIWPAIWLSWAFLTAFDLGWIAANHDNAAECQNLHGFYVGPHTFKCEEVK